MSCRLHNSLQIYINYAISLFILCLSFFPTPIYLSVLSEQERSDVLWQRIIFLKNLKRIGGYLIKSWGFHLCKGDFSPIHFSWKPKVETFFFKEIAKRTLGNNLFCFIWTFLLLAYFFKYWFWDPKKQFVSITIAT